MLAGEGVAGAGLEVGGRDSRHTKAGCRRHRRLRNFWRGDPGGSGQYQGDARPPEGELTPAAVKDARAWRQRVA